MPFNPQSFLGPANMEPEGNPLARNLIQTLMSGYQMGQMPAQMQQQRQSQEIVNALKQAQINKLNQQSQLPFGGEVAPGSVGQAMWLNRIREKHGENSQQYKDAKKSYEADLAKNQYLNEYRDALTQNTDKRFSTTLGKEEQEIADIEAGFMPGSRRSQKLDSEERAEMLERYKLKRQKDISDTQARQRSLFASNVDKTIEEIDPKDLTQYGGIKGEAALAGDKFASALGKAPERYVKYQKALTLAHLLAKQVRQFYGDSITPQIQEKLAELTNPASWANSPEVALEKYNTFKKILQKETGTYRGALKSTKEFEGKEEKKEEKVSKEYIYNPKTRKLELQ